ncbi:hypothetical protein GPECTOR_10g905 [Gonium pectorale]|uniref:Uncharacterized protein n=1 Tax=Gonium pectorale TaxID=33097 RepID=A0A150GR54_GONPE|nr:hypothetical protein GPECTOR_10g905 [Gonium pectorale]|eukprot:KXZ52274.1 hypothetical protein GPECTOR_10g905 [Gonium pectorale]
MLADTPPVTQWNITDVRSSDVLIISKMFIAGGVAWTLWLDLDRNSTRARQYGRDTVGVMLAAGWAASWAPDEAVGVSVRVALPYADRSLPGAVQVPPDVAATLSRGAPGMWAADLSRSHLERGLLGGGGGGGGGGATRGAGGAGLLLRVHLLNVTTRWREDGQHPEAQYSRAVREQVSAALGADGYGVRDEFESSVRTSVVAGPRGGAESVYTWRGVDYSSASVGEMLWFLVHANLVCHGLDEETAYGKVEAVVAMCDLRVGRLSSHPRVRVVVPPDRSKPLQYLDEHGHNLARYALPCKLARRLGDAAAAAAVGGVGGSGGLDGGSAGSGRDAVADATAAGPAAPPLPAGGGVGGDAGGVVGKASAPNSCSVDAAAALDAAPPPAPVPADAAAAAGESLPGGLLSPEQTAQLYVMFGLHVVLLAWLDGGATWRVLLRCRSLLSARGLRVWAPGRRGPSAVARRLQRAVSLAGTHHGSGSGSSGTSAGGGGSGSGGTAAAAATAAPGEAASGRTHVHAQAPGRRQKHSRGSASSSSSSQAKKAAQVIPPPAGDGPGADGAAAHHTAATGGSASASAAAAVPSRPATPPPLEQMASLAESSSVASGCSVDSPGGPAPPPPPLPLPPASRRASRESAASAAAAPAAVPQRTAPSAAHPWPGGKGGAALAPAHAQPAEAGPFGSAEAVAAAAATAPAATAAHRNSNDDGVAAVGAPGASPGPPRCRLPLLPWSLALVAELAGERTQPAELAARDFACLACRDGPRRWGYLHGGAVHLGICDGCARRLAGPGAGPPGECPVCGQAAEVLVEVVM